MLSKLASLQYYGNIYKKTIRGRSPVYCSWSTNTPPPYFQKKHQKYEGGVICAPSAKHGKAPNIVYSTNVRNIIIFGSLLEAYLYVICMMIIYKKIFILCKSGSSSSLSFKQQDTAHSQCSAQLLRKSAKLPLPQDIQ